MSGYCADIKQKFKEGKFKTYARWGGLIATLGLFLTSVFTLVSSCIIASIIGLIIAVVIGVLELPFCCTCFPWCRAISAKMKVFEKYALRGGLYIFIGFGVACLVLISNYCWYMAVWGTCLIVDGIFYIVAHFRGEKWEQGDENPEALGINSQKVKTQAAAKAMGII